ncbi:MAG: hypothetical protein GEU74_16120 [Nitriliruptorales bacterium]|nr:hypothetical protein [Nitriliruptorales bacterium]
MGGWRGSYLFLVVTMIVILGMATACAGGGEPTPTTTTGESAGGQDESQADEDEEPDDTGEQDAESLSWVPFGPSDPDIPTPSWPAYNAFASGDCAALESYTAEQDVGAFGRAMVAVCAAAVDGQQEQWDEVAALAGADPSTLANDCLAEQVSALIDRALDWHERNPDQSPDVQFVRVAGQTNCGAQSAGANGTDSGSTEEPDNGSTEEPETSSTADPEVGATTSTRSSDTIG